MAESPAGYFGIGIYQAKRFENVGVLWRGAYQLGASFIFTIGKRYRRQASDTTATWAHIPLYTYTAFDDFFEALPYGCRLVGVEAGGTLVAGLRHPERAVYLLGAEDGGLPKSCPGAMPPTCHHSGHCAMTATMWPRPGRL